MKYRIKYQIQHPTPHEEVTNTARLFQLLSNEAKWLFIEKNNFYQDAFLGDGLSGIIVRMHDKLQSLRSKLVKPDSYAETVTEILLDISNYALMGAMIDLFDMTTGACTDHLFKRATTGAEMKITCIICNEPLRE